MLNSLFSFLTFLSPGALWETCERGEPLPDPIHQLAVLVCYKFLGKPTPLIKLESGCLLILPPLSTGNVLLIIAIWRTHQPYKIRSLRFSFFIKVCFSRFWSQNKYCQNDINKFPLFFPAEASQGRKRRQKAFINLAKDLVNK